MRVTRPRTDPKEGATFASFAATKWELQLRRQGSQRSARRSAIWEHRSGCVFLLRLCTLFTLASREPRLSSLFWQTQLRTPKTHMCVLLVFIYALRFTAVSTFGVALGFQVSFHSVRCLKDTLGTQCGLLYRFQFPLGTIALSMETAQSRFMKSKPCASGTHHSPCVRLSNTGAILRCPGDM